MTYFSLIHLWMFLAGLRYDNLRWGLFETITAHCETVSIFSACAIN